MSENKTEVKTEDNNAGTASLTKEEKAIATKVIKHAIREAEKNLISNKKLIGLVAKLRNSAWKLARLLVEIQHPGRGDAYSWMMCDKFSKRYEELEVRTKESRETIQKNLEYYNELLKSLNDIDKKPIGQVAECLHNINEGHALAQSNLKLSQEKLEYWQKDLEKLQKDYKKYEIKLLKKQIAEYKRKLPAAEKKLSMLLERNRNKTHA